MKNTILFTFISLLSLGCLTNDTNNTSDSLCDYEPIADGDLFQTAPDDPFTFIAIQVDGDCLIVKFSYGGGCVETDVNLIDADIVMESYPVQKNIRLSLNDTDDCEAIVTVERSYNLVPLRAQGEDKISFNMAGWDAALLYEY
jgi:hypothetical protein